MGDGIRAARRWRRNKGALMMPTSDIAFSPSVKAIQRSRGSREMYAKMEAKGGFRKAIDSRLTNALADANSAYLVTASASGQPYAQHRGGPRGFIRVIDDHTIGFAEYAGNRQYITAGNLAENPRAFMFVMDYAHRRRLKIWGRARLVGGDPELLGQLTSEEAEAVILFEVEAWDTNCPQHIPQKFDADLVEAALEARDREIAQLKVELASLRATRGGEKASSPVSPGAAIARTSSPYHSTER
jgi:uncharacterized protein